MSYTQRLWLSFGPAALAIGALALILVVTSHHESQPAFTGALGLAGGWSFVAAGLVAWSRRPGNNTGRLMVAVGFAWFLLALSDANGSWLFTIGGLFDAFVLAVFVHLLLAFPTGRRATTGSSPRSTSSGTSPAS